MRRALILILFLGFVIIALLVISAFMRQPSRVAILPSGARVEFLGSAIGAATFTTEKPWQKYAHRILPSGLAHLIPPTTSGNCSRSSNSVTFYFRVIDPTGATGGSIPWSNYQAEDETGFRYDPEGGYCGFGGTSPKDYVYGLIMPSFPRRQPGFQFRLLDGNGLVLTTLQVPNPVRGPFPRWQPQALPQTQTTGPVTLTLQSLQAIGNATEWVSVRPKWKLTSSDPAWAGAKARYTSFADATGNSGYRLSPREPAWLTRALVFREHAQDFSAAERFVITNLSIPAAGNFTAVDQSAERQGVKLTALVLAAPGQFCVTNGLGRGLMPGASSGHSTSSDGVTRIECWGGATPFLLLEARDVQPDDEILLRLIDDQGREIKLADSGGYDGLPNGGRMYKRSFTPTPGAKSLTLEILVNRPLAFEFMVNPADVQPAKSPVIKQ